MTEGHREGVSGPSREEVGALGLCTSQGGGTLGVRLAPSRPLVAAVTGDLWGPGAALPCSFTPAGLCSADSTCRLSLARPRRLRHGLTLFLKEPGAAGQVGSTLARAGTGPGRRGRPLPGSLALAREAGGWLLQTLEWLKEPCCACLSMGPGRGPGHSAAEGGGQILALLWSLHLQTLAFPSPGSHQKGLGRLWTPGHSVESQPPRELTAFPPTVLASCHSCRSASLVGSTLRVWAQGACAEKDGGH